MNKANSIRKYGPEIEALLEELRKQYHIGVITNGPSEGQFRKLEHTGVLPYVETILISGEVGVAKPDPRIFRMAAERLGVKPEECVFVGDGFQLDVIGAKKAGMTPVWHWPFSKRETKVDVLTIHKITELKEILKDL